MDESSVRQTKKIKLMPMRLVFALLTRSDAILLREKNHSPTKKNYQLSSELIEESS